MGAKGQKNICLDFLSFPTSRIREWMLRSIVILYEIIWKIRLPNHRSKHVQESWFIKKQGAENI